MSYDIFLRAVSPVCPTCGHESTGPDLPNPTYNLTAIFDLALTGDAFPNANVSEAAVVLLRRETDRPRGLRLLSGRKASETTALLQQALELLMDPALVADFRMLEPANRWGTLEDARTVVSQLLDAAQKHPNHVWDVT